MLAAMTVEALEGRGREAAPGPMPMSADGVVRWEHIQRVLQPILGRQASR